MSAISGFCKKDITFSSSIEESVNKISHRGLDERKIIKSNDYIFCINRLNTLNSQIQPFYSSDKSVMVAIDGEIYNAEEISRNLNLSREITKNPNALILEIYKQKGLGYFEQLNGMFVIQIYDKSEKKIYLIRDKLGLKPMFFYAKNNEVVFASEAKAIISYLGNASIDYHHSLNMIFLAGRAPHTKTIFKDINELEPSTFLEIELKNFSIRHKKYFDISRWISSDEYIHNSKLKDKEIEEQFYEKFSSTVKRHLHTDKDTGVLFSAGLDSSMIGALASQFIDRLNLYYYESEKNDYSKYVSAYQNKFKTKLHKLSIDDKEFIFDIPKMVYHYEGTAKEEGPPIAFLSEMAASNNHKVLLTGDGDTILGGSSVHASFFARSKFNYGRFSSLISRGLNKFIPELLRGGAFPEQFDYLFFPTGFQHSEVLTNLLLFRGERLEEWKKRINLYSFVEDKTERETQAFILDDTLYRFQRYMIRQDRTCSRFSNQFRYPYLDDEIIKLSVNMPLRLKQRINLFRGFSNREKLGVFIEGKSICRSVSNRAGVPNNITYRREVGSPFNSSGYMTEIIKNWNFQRLADHLSIKQDLLKYSALNSYNIDVERICYSFIAVEILLRIFQENEDPEAISEEFQYLINRKNKT